MATKITIEPVTRIEGHMKVETHVTDGFVSDVQVSGQMFRGFEKFLENRHPIDAARIAQRVCGVCHEVHGIASIMALEELYDVKPTPNGHLVRDMILGLHLITDHLLHFYNLSVPDYVDFTKILEYQGNDSRILSFKKWVETTKPAFVLNRNKGNYISDTNFNLQVVDNYFKALKIRSEGGAGIAILGAKAPFAHALLPGGVTTDVTPDKIMKYHKVLTTVADFIENSYIPDVMEVASRYPEYFNIGVSYGNFYANESFNALGSPHFNSGILLNNSTEPFNMSSVDEKIDKSYYSSGTTPDANKAGAYSWIKSPRYKGQPVEVGPLARMIINKDPFFTQMMTTLNAPIQSSTMGRHVARAMECKRLITHLFKLIDAYKYGEPTIHHVDMAKPVSGKGTGFSIAARGALIHHVEAYNGKITKYNMIVPSTWNFGPADNQNKGVVEKSIIGTPVNYDQKNSIEVGRVIRSYDPCTACSVH